MARPGCWQEPPGCVHSWRTPAPSGRRTPSGRTRTGPVPTPTPGGPPPMSRAELPSRRTLLAAAVV
ncbi:hypothetical protein GTW38_11220, partial [Streptomyces sp. SID7804]|nr:hypothetical protein [Streptomyces sp. SID7804]